MAEMGAHSALSGAIAISIYRLPISPAEKITTVIVASSIGHLILDLFPHGHTKKIWKDLISGAIIVPIIFIVSLYKGGMGLFLLSGISLFFGNIFDALLIISRKIKIPYGKKLREFNLWIHWFVRSDSFMADWDVRQPISKESYKGKEVYSWKYGWYNLIPLFLSSAIFLVSL